MRQDQVYGFTDRILARGLGPRGLFLRVSDSDFLIVQPDLSRLAGQAACLRYLREILNHFLGDAHLASDGVLQVTRIASGVLDARLVDVEAAERAADEEAQTDVPAAAELVGQPVAAPAAARQRVDQWSPFVSTDGRHLRVSATLEPVYELKGFSRIGFRMIRRVIATRTGEDLSSQAIAELSAADLLRVDLATIARGLQRVEADGAGERQLSLIIPLSYASLSSVRGRAELIQPLSEASRLVQCGVICEILDIEGVPTGALYAAVSLIKPFALRVVGRIIAPGPRGVAGLKGAGLQALSIECPSFRSDVEISAWAAHAVRNAQRVARSSMIDGVTSARRAGELAALGVTHVSLQGV